MNGELTTTKVPWGPAAGLLSLAVTVAATTYNIGRLQQPRPEPQPAAAPAPAVAVTPVGFGVAPDPVLAPVPGFPMAQYPAPVEHGPEFAMKLRQVQGDAMRRSAGVDFVDGGRRGEPAGVLEIRPTGRSRVSTVGPAPEPPKVVATVDGHPLSRYGHHGAPIYSAPNRYEYPCYAHHHCRGYSRCQYGPAYHDSAYPRGPEPLLPFSRAGHRSETTYHRPSSGFSRR